MSRLPKNVTSHSGTDCKKPTPSMASMISLRQRHAGGAHAADTAHDGLHHAAADSEHRGHQFHGTAYGNFGQQKADEMPQGKLWTLQITKAGGRAEHAHGKEQHQQTVAKGFQAVVDADDGIPDLPAPECLRRGGDKAPDLRQLFIPCIEGRLQRANDPVIQFLSPQFSKEVRGAGSTACPFSVTLRRWQSKSPLAKAIIRPPKRHRKPLRPLAGVVRLDAHAHLHDAPAENDNAQSLDDGKHEVRQIPHDGQRVISGQRGTGRVRRRPAPSGQAPHIGGLPGSSGGQSQAKCVFFSWLFLPHVIQ